ncbi:MAG TPA: amino acid adenylation domain-containing protein, partial [Thermoanaerobaculia bacterium]|nr:amino acid adenylation domain-containing protein [Thermoanaerobaculia bacterium]
FELLASVLEEGRVRLHISMDLLVCDIESLDILFRDLFQLYTGPRAELPALDLSFRDWVLAQPALVASAGYRRSEAYWRDRIGSLPLAPALPLARNPAAIPHPRFTRRGAGLDHGTWQRLKARIARAGLTPTGLLAAVYAEVLATWSESTRFSLNLPVSNRPPLHPQIGEIVGSFSSFVLLEVDASAAEPFVTRALRLQSQLWRDLEHRQACGVWLLRELSRQHRRAPGGLMPVVFTSTLGIAKGSAFASLDWLGETVFEVTQTPQVWLDYLVYEQEGELRWDWDAVEEVFPPGLLDDMFEAHSSLLARLADDEEAWREAAGCRAPASQLRLREAVNGTAAPVPEVGLWELFRRQAAERPEATAVVSGGAEISYGELARRAWALAARLRRAGVRHGQPVAVAMEKGWEQVVAVLAALAAGAPYLPLDPRWPRERLLDLLDGTGAEVVLTQPRLAAGLAWPAGVTVLQVGPALPEGAAEVPASAPAGSPRDLAYVIFTSGSTGRPKGVEIEQRSVVNRILDVNARFGVGRGDRAFAVTALHHDLAVYDLFGMLAAGGAIVLPEPSERPDPERWIELLHRHEVTLWNSVPAFFEMLVACLEAAGEPESGPPPLRRVLLSGDWIPVSLPDRARALIPGLRVIALGGPTETTVWDICFPVGEVDPQWRSIPYGRPMANARYHVLDSRLAPRPVWVPGEIYIGGAGLARGYRGDEEATRASFLLHPETGERLYRSGDLGRFLPDGTIELLGRDDLQVKVQGQRIELGEIEAGLARHPKVQSAVVTLAEGGRLVAFVLPAEGLETAEEAAERLARKTGGTDARPGAGLVIPLERPDHGEAGVGRYVERRSYRKFSRQPVRLEDLGEWMSCLRQLELEGVPFPKYRYPSGGGLYPVQAYLHVKPGRAEGVAPGAYYYHPREHRLVLLSDGVPLDGRLHLEVNRGVFDECAFSLFLVAQMKAIEPVYGEAAAEFCFLEAGYMSQLLMSEAPRHGIGLCPVGQL